VLNLQVPTAHFSQLSLFIRRDVHKLRAIVGDARSELAEEQSLSVLSSDSESATSSLRTQLASLDPSSHCALSDPEMRREPLCVHVFARFAGRRHRLEKGIPPTGQRARSDTSEDQHSRAWLPEAGDTRQRLRSGAKTS
jgi:hypothetical protein